MKLRGKKQNSLIVLHEPNSSDPNTFKKNKKKQKNNSKSKKKLVFHKVK